MTQSSKTGTIFQYGDGMVPFYIVFVQIMDWINFKVDIGIKHIKEIVENITFSQLGITSIWTPFLLCLSMICYISIISIRVTKYSKYETATKKVI